MKYIISTSLLLIFMFLGWVASAKYLGSIILLLFDPKSHDTYLTIWFAIFASFESAFVMVYMVYIYHICTKKKHV